jgi:hypothetical protein
MLKAETGFLIDTYHDKNVIEDDFQLLNTDFRGALNHHN